MKTARSTRLLLSLLLILLALAPRFTQAAGPLTTCTITDLGTLPGGTFSEALAINASGQVVGWPATQDANGNLVSQHAVRWDATATTPIDLGTSPGITSSIASGINASGEVVGASGEVVGTSGEVVSGTAVEWAPGATTPTRALGLLPGGTASDAYAINASGQVVGQADTKDASGYRVSHAVRWGAAATTPTDLGTSRGIASSIAFGINDGGEVVGVSGSTAVEWAPGATTPTTALGLLPGGTASDAYAINASGQVVGQADTKDASGNRVTHAVRWDAAATMPTDLGTSRGIASSIAFGINDGGEVVGVSGSTAVEWAPGATTPTTALGLLPGGTSSAAFAINASGQVVGAADLKDANGNRVSHAARWDAAATTPTDLGTLSGITGPLSGITSTVALGINASGQVVGAAGTSSDGSTFGYAVLWNAGMTTPTDLGSLLPPSSGWVLLSARAINDAVPVQIVGVGTINRAVHGFRLTCS